MEQVSQPAMLLAQMGNTSEEVASFLQAKAIQGVRHMQACSRPPYRENAESRDPEIENPSFGSRRATRRGVFGLTSRAGNANRSHSSIMPLFAS
jgi:hypothetical protein